MDAAAMGERISGRRRACGMTQEQLAGKLYVSRSAVSKWERGASMPEISLLEPLADALEISLEELVIGAEPGEESRRERAGENRQDSSIKAVITMAEQEKKKKNHTLLFIGLAGLICAMIASGVSPYLEHYWDIAGIGVILVSGCLAGRLLTSARRRPGAVWMLLLINAGMILFLMNQIYSRDRVRTLTGGTGCYTSPFFSDYTLNLIPNQRYEGSEERYDEYIFLDRPSASQGEEGQWKEALSEYGMIYGTYRVLGENAIQLDCEILGDPIVIMDPGAETVKMYLEDEPYPIELQYAGSVPTIINAERYGPENTLDYRDYLTERTDR